MQKMTPFGIGTAGFIQLVHMTARDRCRTQLEKNHHVLHQQLQKRFYNATVSQRTIAGKLKAGQI